jgi:hypothetical protein
LIVSVFWFRVITLNKGAIIIIFTEVIKAIRVHSAIRLNKVTSDMKFIRVIESTRFIKAGTTTEPNR